MADLKKQAVGSMAEFNSAFRKSAQEQVCKVPFRDIFSNIKVTKFSHHNQILYQENRDSRYSLETLQRRLPNADLSDPKLPESLQNNPKITYDPEKRVYTYKDTCDGMEYSVLEDVYSELAQAVD
ncbi:hypothetical protein HK096_008786, partial [Nowakowskiella sp. JEL0078]